MKEIPNIVFSDDLSSALDPEKEAYVLHALCTGGHCQMVYGDTTYALAGGDCLITTSHVDMLRGVEADDDFRIEIVYVRREFVEVCTPQSNYGMRGHLALFENPVMRLTPDMQQVCAHNFMNIRRRVVAQHHHFRRDAMINAVQCMIVDFFDFHAELYGDLQVTAPHAQLMQRFLALLDRGMFRQHRDIGFYADQLAVTPKYLSEVCRKTSGKSALYWITRYTALDISRLLRNRHLTLDEICDLFGFSSMSYFVRYVQNNLGAAPSEFRE